MVNTELNLKVTALMGGIALFAVSLGSPVSGQSFATQGDGSARIAFEAFEFNTDQTANQTLLPGFLLGRGMADIIRASVNSEREGIIELFQVQDRSWSINSRFTLGTDVEFLDIVRIDGRDRLLSYQSGNIRVLEAGNELRELDLIEASSNFQLPHSNFIPHVDISKDVNGDGLEDLVIPDGDGFSIIVQNDAGEFAASIKVLVPADLNRIYGADGYRFDPWRQAGIYQVDWNNDQLSDLVFWRDDSFRVHFQLANGSFESTASSFVSNQKIDSFNRDFLADNLSGSVLHSIHDVNGDGVSDLVTHTLSDESIREKQSAFNVFLGAISSGGVIEFSTVPEFSFDHSEKMVIDLTFYDLNSDGVSELLLTSIDKKYFSNSLWNRLKGAMGDDVWLELDFYRLEQGRFDEEANFSQRVSLDGVPSHREPGWVPLDLVLRGGRHIQSKSEQEWPRAFNMITELGDLNGDGLLDLVIGRNTPNGVEVFAGESSSELFSSRPEDLAASSGNESGLETIIAAPNDEEFFWLYDFNDDGKKDIFMHHRFTEKDAHGTPIAELGSEPHRIEVLISR